MLIAAALVPGTVLLVPGAGGRDEDELAAVQDAAAAAIGTMFRSGVDRVVVVAPGRVDRHLAAGWRAGLGEVGIADDQVRWPLPARSTPASSVVRGPGDAPVAGTSGAPGGRGTGTGVDLVTVSAVASAVLTMTEHLSPDCWAGALEVLEVREPRPGARTAASRVEELRAQGRALARTDGDENLGLVVAGSLSARNGPEAPLAADDRAPGADRDVAELLVDGGGEARRRLGDLDPDVAGELGMSGWAPWQVLVGACRQVHRVEVDDVATIRSLGVVHVTASWRCTEARS
jgi:hypothetical protein